MKQPGGRSLPAAGKPFEWLPWSALLLPVFLFFDFILLSKWGYGGDWSPIWTAGRLAWRDPARIYDFALITKLQLPILGNLGVRPFAYPPSTLILLTPFSFLPFWLALACISIGGTLGLALASSRRETDRILLLAAPPVFFAAIIGQPTLLVAALVVLSLSRLESNEVRAGVLLGVAAMVKPTLLIMAPIGLLAGKHWRATASAAATASLIVIASVLAFGTAPWLAWIEALPRFRAIFDASPWLYRNGITPHALSLYWGFRADWLSWVTLPVVILITAAIFARCDDWRAQMVAIVGGSLLVSPYAMNYELAALAPVVLTMRRERLYDVAVPVVWGISLFFNASFVGLAAVFLWSTIDAFVKSGTDDRSVKRGIDVPAGEDDDRPGVGRRLAA